MSTLRTPDYGEPWNEQTATMNKGVHWLNTEQFNRAVACVNAMTGRPDPAAAMVRLKELEEQLNSFADTPANPDLPIPEGVDPFCCMKARCKHWEVFSFQLSIQATKLQARLAQLEWVPVTERLPERDDANEFQDVEWSDGKDIWQGNYKCAHARSATHWRRITLP